MNNILEQKLESPKVTPPASQETQDNVVYEIQDSVSGELLNYVAMGNISETQRRVSNTFSGGSLPITTVSPVKKELVRQKIAQVQTLSKQELVKGIEKNLKKDVRKLEKQAHKIRHKTIGFSAHDMTNILAQIRRIKEQIAALLTMAIEKLRELYISVVLKLRLVTAS